MATSKVISSSKAMSSSSSKPKDSDPSASFSSQAARSHRFSSADHHHTVDGVLRSVYSAPPHPPSSESVLPNDHYLAPSKTADDIWREIVTTGRKELKEEEPDEMMTLEDFLAKAGAGEEEDGEDHEVKMMPMLSFDSANAIQMLDKVEGSIVGFRNGGGGSGRGKRGRAPAMEQLDKAAQQRQKRMIKNRESAARSRERKQAYQVELESLAVKLEEEHEQLLKEREERAKERLKQIMENVVPVAEKRRPRRKLQRARSWTW
ncbi:G-box-binding factor 4 [Linum grandiflorum]